MPRGRSSHRKRPVEKPWSKMNILEKEEEIKRKQLEIQKKQGYLIMEAKKKRRNTILVGVLVFVIVTILIVSIIMNL